MDELDARIIMRDLDETYKDFQSLIPLPGPMLFIKACSLLIHFDKDDRSVCESIKKYNEIVKRNSSTP